jgi:aspartate 1-decarboxylase
MLLNIFRAKLHRVIVTQADLNYKGSVTIDEALLEASGMIENERVQIVNVDNGERFETFIIKGERGSGVICLNGPAARRVQVGDKLIIIAYALMTPEEAKTHIPSSVYVDESNQIIKH